MKRYTGWTAAAVCGVILFILGLLWQDLMAASGSRDWLRIFSNAALFPGTLLTGISLLVKIGEENVFDGIKYALGSLFTHLKGGSKRYATYYDYLHRERPQKRGGVLPMLTVGLCFLLAAVLFTTLFYLFSK